MVSAYVDGEVRGAQAWAMSRHVDECGECRGAAQLICRMKESLRRLGTRHSAGDTSAQATRGKTR